MNLIRGINWWKVNCLYVGLDWCWYQNNSDDSLITLTLDCYIDIFCNVNYYRHRPYACFTMGTKFIVQDAVWYDFKHDLPFTFWKTLGGYGVRGIDIEGTVWSMMLNIKYLSTFLTSSSLLLKNAERDWKLNTSILLSILLHYENLYTEYVKSPYLRPKPRDILIQA